MSGEDFGFGPLSPQWATHAFPPSSILRVSSKVCLDTVRNSHGMQVTHLKKPAALYSTIDNLVTRTCSQHWTILCVVAPRNCPRKHGCPRGKVQWQFERTFRGDNLPYCLFAILPDSNEFSITYIHASQLIRPGKGQNRFGWGFVSCCQLSQKQIIIREHTARTSWIPERAPRCCSPLLDLAWLICWR